MKSAGFAFLHAPRSEASRRKESRAAIILLGLISLLALGGILLFALQERGRLRIVAEYRAFQVASELSQAYDRGNLDLIAQVAGLISFGVYTPQGDPLFRHGPAPARVTEADARGPAQVRGDTIRLLRPLGGFAMMRGRGRTGWNDSQPPPPTLGPGRLVYVEYSINVLRGNEVGLYVGSLLVALALVLAFFTLMSLARNLDAYRAQESRTRELVALGEVARTLSHEIKNPLGVLKIQVALLRKRGGQEITQSVEVIDEEVNRISSLTDRVRQYLSTKAGNPESFFIDDYLRSFARRYGDSLALDEATLPRLAVRQDRGRLDQIMDNLVANALESMEAGADQNVAVSARLARGGVELRVADRGKGIPAADADRVYDLFFTTKTTGSGLGLALARRYAELSGATLDHEAREGGGTVFTLRIPASSGRGEA